MLSSRHDPRRGVFDDYSRCLDGCSVPFRVPLPLVCTPKVMPSALSSNCPTCKATIGDDDRTCARCGADVSVWPNTGRTPLILPGNPALSADMFRGKVSPRRVITGSLIGCVVLFGGLYIASDDNEGAWEEQTAMLALRADAIEDSVRYASALAASSTLAAAPADRTLEPIPSVAPVVVPVSTPAVVAVAPSAAASLNATPAAVPASMPTAGAAAPVRQTPPVVATASATAAGVPSRALATVVPVLRLAPLVSDSLRAGQLLQLRWSVQDRATGKAVPAAVEFTSTDATIAFVDRRTGTVSARRPGTVRVIADAGAVGRTMVALTVYAQMAPTVVASATRAEPLQTRTEAARSSSVIERAPAVTAPVNPTASAPASTPVAPPPRVVTPSVSTPTPTPAAATPVRETRRTEAPDAGDVRTAVDRLVAEVRRGGSRTFELIQFFGDGAEHRVTLVDVPTTIGTTGTSVRVTFQMRLQKYDGGGRPTTRLASVSMDVDKRDAVVTSSAVAISPLRKQ